MKNISYRLDFYSNWHCGSGLAAGADVDTLVIKDANGLPFVPGRTIKGLVKNAFEDIYGKDSGTSIFGDFKKHYEVNAFFSDAVLQREDYGQIVKEELGRFMYNSISNTAISDSVAKAHSLRKTQVVLPCSLYGEILYVPDEFVERLAESLRFIKELGHHRSRGLGRCRFEILATSDTAEESKTTGNDMVFRCTLLSDVILNMSSASTDPNKTLDFIPGNVFLGILAKKGYEKFTPEERVAIFHSGKVRFNDAHPEVNGKRTLRIPASLFYDKAKSPREQTFHHHLKKEDPDFQAKQCRSGFYDLSDTHDARQADVRTGIAIKSEYDRSARRSKDEQLWQYESLQRGQQFLFSISIDPDLPQSIRDAVLCGIVGTHRIGRSKSAQYGLVRIEGASYKEPESQPLNNDIHCFYADGRLIFLDRYGLPGFMPGVEDFGFSSGKVRWDLSQIRTFQYAPWNGKRNGFDMDRAGIEKGSVIIIESPEQFDGKLHVGAFNAEGFGKILYNPKFLLEEIHLGDKMSCGRIEDVKSNPLAAQTSPLIAYLRSEKDNYSHTAQIYKIVNDWVKNNKDIFGDKLASQWGAIRSIATKTHDYLRLYDKLFDEEKGFFKKSGIAQEKWKDRKEDLRAFLINLKRDERFPDELIWKAVVNLASEMGKLNRERQ